MLDTKTLTIAKARKGLLEGDFSAHDLAKAHLDIIKKEDSEIYAYIEVFDDVLNEAKGADEILRKKKESSHILTGIPIAFKDNILIQGKSVTAASKILQGYTAPYNATVSEKLKDTGAVFLGRTNMDEFAMGSSTENSSYGTTKNPHDTLRVPGGSSGGSAAAVSMGGALVALGSDTGGSIRQPASFCGIVGLKPTYGAVSRYGLMAMGSSLDQIGPLGRTVGDVEAVFSAIKGLDPLDSTSIDFASDTKKKDRLIVGVPRHLMEDGVEDDVLEAFNGALEKLATAGHTIKDIELKNVSYALGVYYIIMPAEASTNLARFDGMRFGLLKEGDTLLEDYAITRGEGFGKEVRRRIMLGTYVLSAGYYDAYYNKAQTVRELIHNDFEEAFKTVDVIATPTAPTPAFGIGEKSDPLSMYLSDIFTIPANLTGMPAISVPAGTVSRKEKDLPIGLQFAAPHKQENLLFSVGKSFLNE